MPQWLWAKSVIGQNGFGQIDPYLDWAFDPRKEQESRLTFVGPDARYPLLLKLQDECKAIDFAAGTFLGAARPDNWNDVVWVSLSQLASAETRYFTALVTEQFFLDYFKDPTLSNLLVAVIARMAVSEKMVPPSVPSVQPVPHGHQDQPQGQAEPETVVVGIVDDGLAFVNERFRTCNNASRVEAIWLQDASFTAEDGTTPFNTAAARYGYGRVLLKYDYDGKPGLDTIIDQSTYSGIVDEDEVYRKTGAIDFGQAGTPRLRTIALRASHGTHVMDLACGYPPGQAPKAEGTEGEDSRPIVGVQLPAATGEGTSGASLDTYAIDAIRFIVEQADAISRRRNCGPLPIVINFSFGLIAGSHDGTSSIEQAIDELIRARKELGVPLEIVMPAGNHRLKQSHAALTLAKQPSDPKRLDSTTEPKHEASLDWRVLPDTRSRSHLEIWISGEAEPNADRINLRVTPPSGETSPVFREMKTGGKDVLVWGDDLRSGVCYARYSYFPAPVKRSMFLVTIEATEPAIVKEDKNGGTFFEPERPPAPAGKWQITLENNDTTSNHGVDIWVQRNDTRFGHLPHGRQSYIDDPCYVVFGPDGRVPETDAPDSKVKRSETLNAIASGSENIVVGGYLRKEMSVADYSGEGPTDNRDRMGPDVTAPSDDSFVHRGILAAGNRSSSCVALTGTSVATPQITRIIANRLSKCEPSDRRAIWELAEAAEDRRLCAAAKDAVNDGQISADDAASLLKYARPPAERAGGGRLMTERRMHYSRIEVDELDDG